MTTVRNGPETPDLAGPAAAAGLAAPALAMENITMAFAGLQALTEVSVNVGRGESVAVIGPNGSGKTTLLNVASGIYRPSSGDIRLGEQRVTSLRPDRRAKLGLGRTFQGVELPKDMTVLRVAQLGRHTRIRSKLLAYAVGLPYARHVEREHAEAAWEVLARVGLAEVAERQVQELPYGLAKRLDLARALASEPSVLLLDEPAAGLTEREREDLLALLIDIRAKEGTTFVVVEHDMSFVASLCQHAVVLVSGQKLFDGPLAEMQHEQEVVEALMGRAK